MPSVETRPTTAYRTASGAPPESPIWSGSHQYTRYQVASYVGRIARRHHGRPAVPASTQGTRDGR